MRTLRILALATAALLAASPERAHAQGADTVVVTAPAVLPDSVAVVDSPPAPPPPAPDRWKMGLDLLFTGTSGNESLVVFSTGARVTHLVKKDFELEGAVQARYGRSRGVEVARSLKGSLKFDLHPEARWSPFVFLQAERDPFRKLDMRAGGGAGAKFTALKSKTAEVSLSGSALFTYEQLQSTPGSGMESLRHNARASWRSLLRKELPSGFRFEQTTFYQPLANNSADYLLDAKTSARARVTRFVAVTLTHNYQRDSTPPPEVRPDDHRVEMGLIVEF